MKKVLRFPPLLQTKVTVDICWLLLAPLGFWLIASVYVPLFGGILTPWETWILTFFISLASLFCLVAHVAAHLLAARKCGSQIPAHLPLCPFGDAAQVWQAARTPWGELVIAISGPLCSAALAVGAYLTWNMQLAPYLNLVMLFLVFFNSGLAVINLIPAFPLDGGRLLRAICWGLLHRPESGTVWAVRLGFVISLLLFLWAIFLISQPTHYSLWTGGSTLVLAGLIFYPLLRQPAFSWDRTLQAKQTRSLIHLLRVSLASLLIVSLLSITLALVPINNGLKFPGVSPATTPMVQVPWEHRYAFTGQFLITTATSQTPILFGQWLYGLLSPAAEVVPPERIVPPDTTIREMTERNYHMLESSKTTAAAVGIMQAGYEVSISGQGVRIVSLMEGSLAYLLLQAGDIIIGIDGQPVLTLPELTEQLKLKQPSEPVQLQIQREERKETVSAILMPPSQAGEPPRIGAVVETAGYHYELPFPVNIEPQKVTGGPSAGLMLALTVYNLVTPKDLTGGRSIAGTGTINWDGNVGPVGSVRQKVAGAEFAGAEYFLVPPQNFEEARAAARRITVIQVDTVEEAVLFLQRLPGKPMVNYPSLPMILRAQKI